MEKKLLTILLVLCMSISLFAGVTFAASEVASGTCGDNLTWTLDSEGTLTISGTGVMPNRAAGTAPWYDVRERIHVAIISNGITTIGTNAFCDCYNLVTIDIADSVTKIGAGAFKNCTSITEIIIPQNVTAIYDSIFLGCTALEKLSLPDIGVSFGELFGYQTKTVSMYYGCYRTDYTFNGSYLYPDVRYPDMDEAYTIGSEVPENTTYRFSSTSTSTETNNSSRYIVDCYSHRTYYYYKIPESLRKVTIASGKEISESLFYNGANLEEIILGNGITKIGENIFSSCTALTKITIPDSVTSIGDYAFENCSKLTDVYYGGREADRSKITIGSSNEKLTNATWHYNYTSNAEVSVSTVNGAQIRTKGNQGLRFISTIDKTSADFDRVKEFGIILIPSADISDISELEIGKTLNGHAVAKVEAKKYYAETEDAITFTAVLTDIAEKNYAREYTARAYAIMDDGSVVYSDTGASRSIYAVAKRGLENPDESDENKAVFQAIVNAVDGE